MTDQESPLERRLVTLEEWLMHTDRLISDLNAMVCAQHDRIDEQARQIERLQHVIAQLGETEPEQRSLEDERPPHY
jgi:SlyX protein